MTSRTFLNFDGTCTQEDYSSPVNYPSGDGGWLPIDTTLAASSVSGFAYENTANLVKTYLPATSSGWVRVEAGDAAVSFQPLNAPGGSRSVGGSRLTFQSATSDAALSYEVQPGRLKETVTFDSSGTASLSYALRLEGLTAQANDDGSVSLLDAKGKAALVLEAPWMQDAAGRKTAAIHVSLQTSSEGTTYTLTPDPAWLATATFPVVVDPIVSSGLVWQATARQDSASTASVPGVYGTYGANGAAYYLGIGNPSTGHALRSVVHFTPSLPVDTDIFSARLIANINGVSALNTPMTIEGRELTATLSSASSVTWNNVGGSVSSLVGTDTATFQYPSAPNVTQTLLDVTDIVEHWHDRNVSSLNILLRDVSDSTSTPSGNTLYLSTSSSTPVSLGITYASGWYTFQGGKRRQGNTQNVIGDLTTYTVGSAVPALPTGAISLNDTFLAPSVVLTSDSPGSQAAPIVTVAVPYETSNGDFESRVYRYNSSLSSVFYATLQNVNVTGTPLLLGNAVYVTGNLYSGPHSYPYLFRLVGTPASAPTSFTVTSAPIGPSGVEGYVASSPVYSVDQTQYTQKNSLGGTSTATGGNGAILVTANVQDPGDSSKSPGHCFAKDPLNLKEVWGTVEVNGDPVLTSQPDATNATYSSPGINRHRAYFGDSVGFLHSLDVKTGSTVYGTLAGPYNNPFVNQVDASVSLFEDKIYMAGEYGAGVYGGSFIGTVSCLKESADRSGADTLWSIPGDYTSSQYNGLYDLNSIFTTPAVDTQNRNVFFAEEHTATNYDALAFSVSADAATAPLGWPVAHWSSPTTLYSLSYYDDVEASPIVTGDGSVLFGGLDKYLHVVNQSTGALTGKIGSEVDIDDGGGAPVVFPFNSGLRSTPAVGFDTVYVLTNGTTPTLYRIHFSEQ